MADVGKVLDRNAIVGPWQLKPRDEVEAKVKKEHPGQMIVPGLGPTWKNGVGIDKARGVALTEPGVPLRVVQKQVEIDGGENEPEYAISGPPTKRGDGMLEYPIAPLKQVLLMTVDSVSISGK